MINKSINYNIYIFNRYEDISNLDKIRYYFESQLYIDEYPDFKYMPLPYGYTDFIQSNYLEKTNKRKIVDENDSCINVVKKRKIIDLINKKLTIKSENESKNKNLVLKSEKESNTKSTIKQEKKSNYNLNIKYENESNTKNLVIKKENESNNNMVIKYEAALPKDDNEGNFPFYDFTSSHIYKENPFIDAYSLTSDNSLDEFYSSLPPLIDTNVSSISSFCYYKDDYFF